MASARFLKCKYEGKSQSLHVINSPGLSVARENLPQPEIAPEILTTQMHINAITELLNENFSQGYFPPG